MAGTISGIVQDGKVVSSTPLPDGLNVQMLVPEAVGEKQGDLRDETAGWRVGSAEASDGVEEKLRAILQGTKVLATRQPRYSMEEFAQRGTEIYERVVQPTLKPEHVDLFLAIDIESEDFELDVNDCKVTDRLHERRPDAQIWLMRVGHPAAYRIGRPLGNGGLG